jgi:hypothetical protein
MILRQSKKFVGEQSFNSFSDINLIYRIFISVYKHGVSNFWSMIYFLFLFCVSGFRTFFQDPDPLMGNPYPESVFLNVYGAQESIPRNEFRQSM